MVLERVPALTSPELLQRELRAGTAAYGGLRAVDAGRSCTQCPEPSSLTPCCRARLAIITGPQITISAMHSLGVSLGCFWLLFAFGSTWSFRCFGFGSSRAEKR